MKKCKTCDKCKQLYRRPEYRFYKDDKLYCTEREYVTDGDGCCECWQKKYCENESLSERFDEAIDDIKYLMKCLAEY